MTGEVATPGRRVRDLVVVLVVGGFDVWLEQGRILQPRWGLPPPPGWLIPLVIIVAATALLARRRHPMAAELHRLVELLRDPDGRSLPQHGPPAGSGPRPELAALDGLVERARADGLVVTVEATGEPRRLDPSVDQAGYRIVQESLTNAIKHAGTGARVRVGLAWRADELVITVRSDGGAGPPGGVASSGYGLRGLRERVSLLGGSVRAGPEPDRVTARETWVVRAELPSAAAASPAPAPGDVP